MGGAGGMRPDDALKNRHAAGRLTSLARPHPGAPVHRGMAILGVVAWLYMTVLICLGAWVVFVSVSFGWRPVVLTSTSMAPSAKTGDVLLLSDPPPSSLSSGTIVAFDDPELGLVTHRIVAVNDDGTYRTKGDFNPDLDVASIAPDQVVGVGRMLVPLVGLPVSWLHSGNLAPLVAFVLVGVLAIVAILAQGVTPVVRSVRRG